MSEKGDVFNLQQPVQKSHDGITELRSRFEADRAKMSADVLGLAERMRDMRNLADVGPDLFYKRQVILEQNHTLQTLLARMSANYRKQEARRLETYMTGKMKVSDQKIMVAADLADEQEKIDLLSSQVEFMKESMKGIENMIYGVKNRIAVEEYRRPT